MKRRKNSSLNRILGRLDNLDTTNLTILVQRLARERELLEMVFNSIHDGILVLDSLGTIQYANRPSLDLVGLSEDDIGKTILTEKWPDLNRWIDFDALDKLDGPATAISREIEMTYPQRQVVRLFLIPMDLSIGKSDMSYLIVLSDITEEKESTLETIKNENIASIMLLAAGVAHEIGNPLNSLTIHLQLIKRKLEQLGKNETTRRIEKSVEVCAEEVNRLDGILTHFLGAIRNTPPDFQDIDLLLIIEEVVSLLEESLITNKIEINVEVDSQPPVVLADINQIKQVFYNVLKNAMEAMPRGGFIKIKPRSDDEFVYIMIADTGCGIDQEDLSKIFQPYFSTKKDGHGLGMMVVNRIMNSHGAKIGIDSKKDKGTVVTLQFPQKHRRIRLLSESS
jgi:two-component system, sporulation sensor kinase E